MANVAEHGNGVTITLSGGLSVVPYSITMDEQTSAKINVSDLATTAFEEYDFSDLAEPGGFTAVVVAVTTAAAPTVGTKETGTVTYSIPSGASSGATLVGTGAVDSVTPPNATKNERLEYSIHFSFDGVTGPAFTVAS